MLLQLLCYRVGPFVVVFVAVVVGLLMTSDANRKRDSLPWHQTPQWQQLLRTYDDTLATRMDSSLRGCKSRYISTDFGETHVVDCGVSHPTPPAQKPLALFFHGAGSNSLMYSDWILPRLRTTHHCVALDFVCDTGKSSPPEGDPERCPQDEASLAEWVRQVVRGLDATTTTSTSTPMLHLVGYSYGSFVATAVAKHVPVERMVWMAPASVVAPVQLSWIWRAIFYGLTRTEAMHN